MCKLKHKKIKPYEMVHELNHKNKTVQLTKLD